METSINPGRWRPSRSGLINLFKYTDEVFHFEDGHLLLRGNNGAGKSRVLALQLPFLLDGDISSHRVEPDGDPAKKMEWNLLMGGRYENRLGYTWIEFTRTDEEGAEHHITLACGLHARRHGDLKRWFLITPMRIGLDLRLISEDRVPLTKDRIIAALDGRGQVFDRPREYRAAVDDALFQLGPRYGPLIELLIRLRQPQLSRKLDENILSDALSDALPPLYPTLIDDVAASFRGIDDDREAMNDFRASKENVGDFLQTYQHYAAIVVRRHAENIRIEHSQHEHRAREIKRFGEERQNLEIRFQELSTDLEASESSLTSHRAAERALRDSPEMKSVETLRLARERRDDRDQTFQQARRDVEQEEIQRAVVESEREAALKSVESRQQETAAILKQFQQAGANAQFPLDDEPVSSRFDERCGQREEGIRHLQQQNKHLAEAQSRHHEAQRDLERAQGDLESANESEQTAVQALTATLDQFTADVLTWERSLRELTLLSPPDWREAIESWLENRESTFPLESAVRIAHGRAQTEWIGIRQTHEEQQRQQETEIERIRAEWAHLESGQTPEPPIPHTREPQARLNRLGAPFWQLCEFRDDVSLSDRAGYEAALEAAGILDAWLTPDGTLIRQTDGDAVLIAGDMPSPAPEQGLNRILRVDSTVVPQEVIHRLLGRIGECPDAGPTWVAATGDWQNGPLRGVWTKAEAQYIGFNAREKSRLRKMEELKRVIEDLQSELETIRESIQVATERLERIDEERDGVPGSELILKTAATRDAAREAVRIASERVAEAGQNEQAASQRRDVQRLQRDNGAADLGLTPWRDPEDLESLVELMNLLRQKAVSYWYAARALGDAKATLERAEARWSEAQQRFADKKTVASEANRRLSEAQAEWDTLKDTLGKTAEEVITRLTRTQADITATESRIRQLRSDASKTEGDVRVKDEQIRSAEANRVERQTSRDMAIERFRSLAECRFIEEASPELQPSDSGWSVTSAVDLARRAEQILKVTGADDEDLARAQTELQTRLGILNDQLGSRGYHPRAQAVHDGVLLVQCDFQGQNRAMNTLHKLLEEEVDHRSKMLDEREREVIENHLIGEVAKELQERIRSGETWVSDVNAELEKRPTSSGVKLKFAWRVDPEGPPGVVEANQQLLRTAATWSPEERRAIGDFLQNRIRTERTENPDGSWQEHLRRALDYRTWRRFDVERWQDGKWMRLTKRTYGTGSGGEKAMTLTVPQFAAAAAHYRSASPQAPRLILLDEAFVGIDGETRAKLMGLLHTFDLDYVMTSEREWGCYASVPSLAIYQLASRPEIQAVHVTRWVWNGQDRQRASPEPESVSPPEHHPDP